MTNLSPFENELLTLQPAPKDALEEAVLKTFHRQKLHSIRQKAVEVVDTILFELSDEEKRQVARIVLEDVLKNVPERSKPMVQVEKKKPKKKTSSLAYVLHLIILWGVVMTVVLLYHGWYSQVEQQLGFNVSEKPQEAAVMVDVADVQWKGKAPKLGESLLPGALALESGTVELLFYNGVRTIIEGPADLLLINDTQVFCRQGNWSVMVPPSGVGFEIQTPQATIRDLGTQFFAAIDQGNCDVHVLKGTVELEDAAKKKTVYQTNQAVEVRGSEMFARLLEPERFVTKTEMRQRRDDYLQRNPPPVWERTEPILSVDFREESPQGVTLFSGGREDSAFRFADTKSRIRLQSLGKLSSFTVLIGIKIDRLNNGHNPILMSEGTKRGGLVWNITPNGMMFFGLRGQSVRETRLLKTPIAFTEKVLGEWVQLGLCIDGERERTTIYLNGDPIRSEKWPSRSVDLSQLDIGNWISGNNVHPINGAVKSIMIFNRALELNEVRKVADSRL